MSPEATTRIRCMVLSVDIGAGHRSAAEALCAAIDDIAPGSKHQVLEALDYLGPGAGTVAKELYFGVLQELPDLWGMLYQERGILGLLSPVVELVDDLRSSLKLAPVVHAFRPHVVVAVHPIACGLAAALARGGDVNGPAMAVLTDYDAHPSWVVRGLEHYLVPSEQVADDLGSQGVRADRVTVTGIPLRAGFAHVRGRAAPQLPGLEPGRFTILMLGGGLGLGPILETAEALASLEGPIQLALVCGSNHRLQQAADQLARHSGVPLKVWGRVDNIWDQMAAADLAVGKPGGLTCAELMAVGLPLVALAPIPGQEQANCDALVRQGVALHAPDPASARAAVLQLLCSPARRQQMRQAALRLGRPNAARQAARTIIQCCGRS